MAEKNHVFIKRFGIGRIVEHQAKHELILDNGLARRVFQLTPNAACISMENLTSRELLLRAIAPAA